MSRQRDRDQVSMLALATPVVKRWRVVLVITLLAATLTAAWLLLSPRRYRASMALSTIVTQRGIPASAGLTALLSMQSAGGLQATPALVVSLAEQHGVLDRVAQTPVASGGQNYAGWIASAEDVGSGEQAIVRKLRQMIRSSFDRQTGVVTLDIVSRDSALARALAGQLVGEISHTFIRATKAQASEQRVAMQARVDSAVAQLRRAEENLRFFLATNRDFAPFSAAAIERQRLNRALDQAQTIYSQAVADRETAVARELEETPAVIVLDPVSRTIMPEPRRVALKTAAVAILAFFLSTAWLLITASLAAGVRAGDEEAIGFVRSVAGVPLAGRPAKKLLKG